MLGQCRRILAAEKFGKLKLYKEGVPLPGMTGLSNSLCRRPGHTDRHFVYTTRCVKTTLATLPKNWGVMKLIRFLFYTCICKRRFYFVSIKWGGIESAAYLSTRAKCRLMDGKTATGSHTRSSHTHMYYDRPPSPHLKEKPIIRKGAFFAVCNDSPHAHVLVAVKIKGNQVQGTCMSRYRSSVTRSARRCLHLDHRFDLNPSLAIGRDRSRPMARLGFRSNWWRTLTPCPLRYFIPAHLGLYILWFGCEP